MSAALLFAVAIAIPKIEYLTDPPPSHYKRAWEIMNAEGSGKFIDELKQMR